MGTTVFTAVTTVMGLNFVGHGGGSGDGDSIHGSTAVTVGELKAGLLFVHGLK